MILLQSGAPLASAAHGCSAHITYAEAGIIGLIQGVTELFPISSLGHNVLLPAVVGGCWAQNLNVAAAQSPYLAFIVGLHVATAIALIIYFWRDWVRLTKGFFSSLGQLLRPEPGTSRWDLRPDERLAWLIILATIPVGLAGLALDHVFRMIFAKPATAAVFLLINGVILIAGERFRRRASLEADEQIAAEREYAVSSAHAGQGGYRDDYRDQARFQDERQYQGQGQYRDDQQYHQGQGRFQDDRQYQGQGRFQDERQYQGQGRFQDDRQYQDQGRFQDDRQYQGQRQYRDDQEQYQGQRRFQDDRQYQGQARFGDDDRYYRDQARYPDERQYRDDRRQWDDQGYYGDEDRHPSGSRDRREEEFNDAVEADERLSAMSTFQAVLIGSSQVLALLAGISRDGVAMVGGMARGLSREDAARFAFLLATPVILAAGALKIPDLMGPLGNGIHGQILLASVLSGVGSYL
ncbi:MAG TPA: undecaprenyl-diphosphate phosphatase, partial [Streptosporangiaceae bacterium]|nr:undecaprenyl-diphosphate phosphatase [Streptosporangiaceae bacterium]